MKLLYYFIIFITICFLSCSTDKEISPENYNIKNVIVILVDGARYSETYGDPTHQNIPNQLLISQAGIACTQFFNDGVTNTFNGHTALMTGVYESLNNTGMQPPTYPTVFQNFRKQADCDSLKTWIVSSKDKLQALNSCMDSNYCYRFKPSTDCGIDGLFSGTREDSTTFNHAMRVLKKNHPNLILISFKEPDASAHAGNWPGYINGIKKTDEYVGKIYDFIQTSAYYKNSTALFITNDHGRHLDGISNGFVSHGDSCEGCRHINLIAFGPCFKTNFICSDHYDQNDIATTIAYLLHFNMPDSHGEVMQNILK